jgi:hypothetical protein
MNRSDFGHWGIELSRQEFSQALAALGVIIGEGIGLASPSEMADAISDRVRTDRPLYWYLPEDRPLWYLSTDPTRRSQYFRSPDYAGILKDAWRSVISAHRDPQPFDRNKNSIRLEIQQWEYEFSRTGESSLWFLEELGRPEVGVDSVYLGDNDDRNVIAWDFPLRIGMLDDPISRELRSDLEQLKFHDELLTDNHIELVGSNKSSFNCHVLLLPHDLKSAAAALLNGPTTLNTDCVIVIGRVNEARKRILPLILTIKSQSNASGVCLSPVSIMELDDYHLDTRQIWFKEFIRHISHNEPLDVALFRARPHFHMDAVTPLIFASPKLIRDSRLSDLLIKFQERLSRADKVESETVTKAIREAVSSENDLQTFEELSRNYTTESVLPVHELDWSAESRTATSFSKMKKAAEEALRNVPAKPTRTRYIQAEIWEHDGENGKRRVADDTGLLISKTYSVIVFIGTPNKVSISADQPFSDQELPQGKNEHELKVIFTEANISSEAMVSTIVLPKYGDSSQCEFVIRVPENLTFFCARITIAYRNRVLQTALLEANVFFDSPGQKIKELDKKGIQLLVESVIRPGMQDLTERKLFDGAFVVNHDRSGTSQITSLVGDDAELISIEGIADKIKWFDDTISDVAKSWEKFGALNSKKSQDLLRNCAWNGVALYKALMAGREEGVLRNAERIQIVSAKYGSRLPLEFVYGRRAPEDGAPICEHAKQALLDGHCDASCPTGKNEKTTVCPLGFWGLNRVIERHAYDAQAIKDMPNADFALQAEPMSDRRRLKVLTCAVVAASDNVDNYEPNSISNVVSKLAGATNNNVNRVGTWDDWVADIEKRSPSLLVLLPHTTKDIGTGLPKIEISGDQDLKVVDLQVEHVLGPTRDPRPLVVLMGCKTASPDIPYESIIVEVRRLGAALVVGTGSTILGRHAAPVTAAFIEAISRVGENGISFGDIMLDVRRKMIADGLLMSLCLTSYGDTDWLV